VVAITATAEPANLPPRVLVSIDFTSLTPDPTEATVMRNDPDGRQRAVRLAEPAALAAGLWQGYDYESPFGQAVTYEATSVTPAGAVTSSSVTLNVTVPWLRHPGIPTLSVPVPTDSFRKDSLASRARATSRAVFTPLGRETPIVVTSGVRSTPQTDMTLRTDTDAERDALWALLATEAVVLLDIPPGLSWGVTHEFISVGDVVESRVADWGSHASRWFSLPYLVVDRPAGGLQAQFTYADVLADHATYALVRSRYNTYSDLLANNRNSAP
jgi:hypothetical protein